MPINWRVASQLRGLPNIHLSIIQSNFLQIRFIQLNVWDADTAATDLEFSMFV